MFGVHVRQSFRDKVQKLHERGAKGDLVTAFYMEARAIFHTRHTVRVKQVSDVVWAIYIDTRTCVTVHRDNELDIFCD